MNYSMLLNNIYSQSNKSLTINILKTDAYELNCFIKSNKVGSYPPRLEFKHKWHLITQDNQIILKQNSQAVFCFNNEVM